MQDVVQRRRRVFGPAHPKTVYAESVLSDVRARLTGPELTQRGRFLLLVLAAFFLWWLIF